MTNFIQVTPFLHVRDLETALAFFVDLLGFAARYRQPGYAYVHRETVGFRLLEAAEATIKPRGAGGFAYYIDVRDVDAVVAELTPRLAAPAARRCPRAGRSELWPARVHDPRARWRHPGLRPGDRQIITPVINLDL